MFRRGEIKDKDLAMVASVGEEYEANLIKGVLEENRIPVLIYDREDSGNYLRIIGCGSPFGLDIYVHKSNEERARTLINEIFSEEKGISDEELERMALEASKDE